MTEPRAFRPKPRLKLEAKTIPPPKPASFMKPRLSNLLIRILPNQKLPTFETSTISHTEWAEKIFPQVLTKRGLREAQSPSFISLGNCLPQGVHIWAGRSRTTCAY